MFENVGYSFDYRLKANFSVSEAEYIATRAAQQVAGQPVSGYL
jgi:hypothetical protein